MECPTCKADLAKGSKYCSYCGTPVSLGCPTCGHVNVAPSNFCVECGASLNRSTAPPPLAPAPEATPPISTSITAERRQLSVMFCDLVGSVAIAERMDPEDFRDILSEYQREATKTVELAGGLVARYLGDGILAYFGYPLAHEHDAEEAISAGLKLVEAIGNLEPANEKLRVRIGIATGVVIVGELVASTYKDKPPIVGETPNLAARLQTIAEPNSIVIDEQTHQLTGRLFEYRDLGMQDLKGFVRPIRAWQVLERSTIENRFEALHSADLPLVGRDEELERLLRRWQRAIRSEGQVVLLSGQAGIGKSRLAAALQRRLQDERHAVMRCSCSPQHHSSALYPVISQLVRAAGISRNDSDEDKWDKLRTIIARSVKDEFDLALIADLLSISTKDRVPSIELSPQTRKLRTFAVLKAIIEELASSQPLLIIFEDVHWIDPTSLELIELCIDAAERQKLLLIITTRPGFASPWTDRPYVCHISLNRLNRSHASEIISNIAGRIALPRQVFGQILDRADGVPLFVEELTKTVVESSRTEGTPPSGQAIPSTLQASLLERLDRMSPVRDVVQIAAAIGREFDFDLLCATYRFSEDQLRDALNQLVAAELIYRRTEPPNDSYKFKHALVQDAAYGTLLRDQRKELHARIARSLERDFPERALTEPEVLAFHFSQAGLTQPAIKYWQAAAQRATERAASVEAVSYFDKALALVETTNEGPERDQQELSLLIGRGIPLTAIGSYAAPEVGDNYRRAHELCNRMGSAPQMFPVLQGLYRFYLVSAELQPSLDTATQLLEIAENAGDPSLRMEAYQALAFSYGFRGELEPARENFHNCMALFDPDHFRGRMHLYSTDTATSALCLGSLIAWLRGFTDQSAAISQQALARARLVDHPYTLAWALSFTAVLAQLQGDTRATLALSAECVAHSERHDFPFWLASSRIMHGWALVDEGEQVSLGLTELQEGLAGWLKTGARVYAPYFTCCFAEACLSADRPDDGLEPLARMIEMVERTGERWWQPELYRLTGELASKAAVAGEYGADPEQYFRKALDLATQQGARSLELRATMSLCKRWMHQKEKRTTARRSLAAIYDTFNEGASTRDMLTARKLLQELSRH